MQFDILNSLEVRVDSKNFLICVDSDGCVMDGMTIKHIKCFYPCIAEIWELPEKSDLYLNMWNKTNLFSIKRGINRFKGLEIFLRQLKDEKVINYDIKALTNWVKNTETLSNHSLEEEISKTSDKCLKKALKWSERVNEEIENMPKGSVVPFDWTKRALSDASIKADIAIVSSANKEAVISEWTKHGLIQYTKFTMTQEEGTKTECIKKLIKTGYFKENVLMIGDATSDELAARNNEVLFYPIIAGKEELSWEEFVEKILAAFFDGKYKEKYMNRCIEEFYENLEG